MRYALAAALLISTFPAWQAMSRPGERPVLVLPDEAKGPVRTDLPVLPAETPLAVPYYDVDGGCAKFSNKISAAECVRQEQASYDYIKAVWPIISEKGRAYCLKGASPQAGRFPYYLTLASYVQGQIGLERIERDRVVTPRFRP